MNIKNKVSKFFKNAIGKSVKEKYIIFESDDWGSIRMPSVNALNILKKHNINFDVGDNKRYTHFDTLATKEDFIALYEVLSRYKDLDGNYPVFTAVSVVANPDFEKIESDNFSKYYYEPFTKTLERYGNQGAIEMWREGIDEKLFYPEFHGREHLNVPIWLRALQDNDKVTKLAFKQKTWAVKSDYSKHIFYEAAFDVDKVADIEYQKSVIKEGLELFEKIHGYKAQFIVPPNGPFNNELEETCASNGIKYVGAAKVQKQPLGNNQFKNSYHWLGQKNRHGQTYLTRYCLFEPNSPGISANLDTCLSNIQDAFSYKKPAVISSHRTNYVSSLSQINRDDSLRQLDTLLKEILKRWPDVRFITSTELGKIISKGK